ncbi:MAG: hypothetical protein B7Y25_05470 [Alphaproteobacteria bacterium 16-39-46]|nr:MAG: hypothetical protein B7Y25_05470 [Alphaproteobacteria bacterium 16-39-46]OZA44264.1 MAG: hypothetical protein B7X84_00800 [Alphaproteobacteria bacterium 17-39-52]HQS84380.1 multidrug effflux MFS transporter [Alphaproteobacteria bacterium]HQS94205.1 multidrug effflux MFS transporter [Alphaproteobacteria bacterium]
MTQTFSKGILLLTIILMDLLAGMEFDLFSPSFPELQAHFCLTPFWVEALLSVNFIGYCLSLFFVGSLADRYGRKVIIVIGLLIFIISSFLCLSSPSYSILLFGRFFQGAGIAAPAILSFLIIADSYPLKKQQSLFAILNGIMNASVGVAPVIGSYVSLYFHWQGTFITLLLFGVVTLLMTLIFIPHTKAPEHREPFSIREYLPIFKSKSLVLLILKMVFSWTPYWIFVGMSPLLYMEALGVSLSHFGYYQGALASVFALGSLFFGLIINRYNQKKMLYSSNYLLIVGLICITIITFLNSSNALLITVSFIPYIIAGVIPSTLLYPICLNFMPKAKGRVSATLRGTHLILSALSLQLAGYFYRGSFQNIGIIISGFIVLSVITLFLILKNQEIMRFFEEKNGNFS